MPTQKQLKTTQKVGGKAPVTSAKSQAKTQGGKAPAPAKSPAKTRGGKAPTTPTKAPVKTQGGKAPTTPTKAPAKTGGTDGVSIGHVTSGDLYSNGTKSLQFREHVEFLESQKPSRYDHHEMNVRSNEYATIGEMVYYVRNREQNINQAFIKSFNELGQAFTKNFGEVSNDLKNHKKYVESQLKDIYTKIDKLENQLKTIEQTMNFNNEMNNYETNPLSTKLETLEAKLERLHKIVIGIDNSDTMIKKIEKFVQDKKKPLSRPLQP